MEPTPQFRARAVERIADVEQAIWNACAASGGAPHNPFVDHRFLKALEESGSVGPRTGWTPAHIALETGAGAPAGFAPCYLKTHSQGEYVFDHGFADAYERAGGSYYPKLQAAVPFTPATGPRLLAAPDQRREQAQAGLAAAMLGLMRQTEASSVHVTFATEEERALLVERGFLARDDQQFHWRNDGYGSYDDFLADLASRKRKQLKRERRDAVTGGITIRRLAGRDVTEAHWDAFFDFYMDTGSRKWGRPYLNRRFFSLVGEAMPESILLVLAERDGRPIAGALNFIGGEAIYGRYWGAIEEHSFLHFEVCYHQAIEAAIERGLGRVEAGAQGEHKLARGYRPVTTRSAHAFADPGLARAVADYLARERRYVAAAQAELEAATPFRRAEAG
ncbi:N-acetyltransferase [Chelatococcus sambhunathii]|uniref:N-acetyltransferase n=1 Tax=Chelatococcus sambhunathii TaxID=363953 RepID=A0ABU1DE93_9HYPH|nr:GNAT family N-acetyltransferase [Chelatococcus sambhunathii]MDR4306434.1 N-acetyltransferase [Chelatococcus sambhunathii]